MRAQTLSISIPNSYGCDKECPYCISRITGAIEMDKVLFHKNFNKVKRFAEAANITSVIITSKGEPTLDFASVIQCIDMFQDFPTELQTNGRKLLTDFNAKTIFSSSLALSLSGHLLNVCAFSIDRIDDIHVFGRLFRALDNAGVIVRVTLAISDMISSTIKLSDIIKLCKENGIRQLSIRKLTVPNFSVENDVTQWIRKHDNEPLYRKLCDDIRDNRMIRKAGYGIEIYDVGGISVTHFDYCIQDFCDQDDIRSLIYMEDGHLYTSWNSKASILF